jgi:cysteine desulfurase
MSAVAGTKQALGDLWGNPSNIHRMGESARRAIQLAGCRVARFLGVGDEASVGFTSGGTESNRQVIHHMAERFEGLAFLETEHSSVIEAYSKAGSKNVAVLRVGANGVVNIEELELKLARDGCKAISIQWANSETGVIQPIGEILNLCELHGATIHVDAAQVIGKIPLDPELVSRIDFMTFTAHKMHGPQGVGVIVTGDSQADFDTLFPNTHTPNTPGIIGFGEVVKERLASKIDHTASLQSLRDKFEAGLLLLHPGLKINAAASPRIPNTSNIQFTGVDGAALVAKLDLENIICSQVSACLTGRPEPSYVLTAMGFSEESARSSIRFSFSIFNTDDEVDAAVKKISECYNCLLKQSQLLIS